MWKAETWAQKASDYGCIDLLDTYLANTQVFGPDPLVIYVTGGQGSAA